MQGAEGPALFMGAAGGIGGTGETDEAAAGPIVERVGSRTFYRVGERWVDEQYDESQESKKLEAYSPEYFELIRKHPELAKCFALGERVIVVLGKTAYETVPPAEE